jgi:putative SOS response-associated peptidase YedK
MPVILHEKDESKWLDTELTDFDKLTPILKPYPSDLMEMYQVSDAVNSPRNETPECVKPVKIAKGQ